MNAFLQAIGQYVSLSNALIEDLHASAHAVEFTKKGDRRFGDLLFG
ncbi:hypothetical protein [Pontibacter sp. G13]|nr:hypothetical protein [Pontibacter sp. G13]WNJ20459.1 hypothetical protein RJD25_08255 [Pontibacter sp. G13]